jgi:hypothetical protein
VACLSRTFEDGKDSPHLSHPNVGSTCTSKKKRTKGYEGRREEEKDERKKKERSLDCNFLSK